MLTFEELKAFAADLQSHRVERKRTFSDPDRVKEAICAFANDLPGTGRPGYVLIGVEDDGRFAGMPVTGALLLDIANLRDDGTLQPVPSMEVYKLDLPEGGAVAVVEVRPADSPPVRFRGRTWIRVGPRRAIATPDDERRLTEKRVAKALTWDQRPCWGSTTEDLDLLRIRSEYLPKAVSADVLAENQRRPADQLASLRLVDPESGVPTNAGMLLFGKDPNRFIPGAYVQFVRSAGLDRAAPVLDHRMLGPGIIAAMHEVDIVVPMNVRVARVFPPTRLAAEDVPTYPVAAVRELVVNAVTHRSYELSNAPTMVYWFSDRVEVLNHGGLYGTVTPENFGRVMSHRNPVVAEVLRAYGWVEKFGYGITKVRRACDQNHNPPPEFEFGPTHFQATLRERPMPQ